jgi:nitrite reductase/ring-hydroxylating ferredoxin subunit
VAREHPIGRVEDLPEGHHRVVRVGGREIGVFNIGGSFHGLPNLCPHQRGPLCEGSVSGTLDYGPRTGWKLAWIWEGEVVTCPWHSLEFHIPTGRCVAFDDIRLRSYEVRAVDGELRVVI